MTTTPPNADTDTDNAAASAAETVTGTIDGRAVTVPKGTMIIRAAESLGTEIPRFCDHPRLEPVAACRQCLVEIEGMPKPQPSCAIPLGDDMVVRTQHTSEVAADAQEGVMEFLLINHPLDCPVCDKGGECPLQNQAMTSGRSRSRFTLAKREFPKPINVSAQVLLDRERCVSCARCTRFADEIAGDPLLALTERGARQQVGVGQEPFDSYFSGNTIQICPVGALTSAEYRFRSRPFDLVSVPTICEHCASGCALRSDIRHGSVMRRQAWDDPEVNEDWNCDKGRFAFPHLEADRLTSPLVREDGQLRPASWPEALRRVADRLSVAGPSSAVLTGGRLTLEDAYAYSRFARVALGTDDIDFRSRASSPEERDVLAGSVAGTAGPTYADLERAPAVLLVGLDPEDESPIVHLRLRKAARAGTKVLSMAAMASPGLIKESGRLIPTVPGQEAAALADLSDDDLALLNEPGAIILVGERLAAFPGAMTAAARAARETDARLAWIPRRAGERGALDAGALSGLLPGGRPLTDPRARADVAAVWDVSASDLPAAAGRDTAAVIQTLLADRERAQQPQHRYEGVPFDPDIEAVLVAGIEDADQPDPESFLAALDAAPFVVSLETRTTGVTQRADVVLPVSVVTEKSGTFVDWEGRRRPFDAARPDAGTFTDAAVLAMIGDRMDLNEMPKDVPALRAEIESLGAWAGDRPEPPDPPAPAVGSGDGLVLASWRQLLDSGSLQVGEPHLAATARDSVARLSAATARSCGVEDGDHVRVVGTNSGCVTLPAVMTQMVDGVVWVPFHSPGCHVTSELGVVPGGIVRLEPVAESASGRTGPDDGGPDA